jgi:predicted transcriptional regulator
MKSVLISIQPYWVEKIASGEKTIEVRKNFPKDKDWNRIVKIYCSKDKKSFSQIPKKYQPLMKKFLGKVIGEFVCRGMMDGSSKLMPKQSCLTLDELMDYSKGKRLYGWRIADLKIYDKPKELSEFKTVKLTERQIGFNRYETKSIERPPQSWCYVEENENER